MPRRRLAIAGCGRHIPLYFRTRLKERGHKEGRA